jgi:hypothetical protein
VGHLGVRRAGASPGLGGIGSGVALVGGVGSVVGSALPWIETGRRRRSALAVIRLAHDLDVLETTRQRVAVSALLALPILVPLAAILVALSWRRSAALALVAVAVVGGLAGAIGLRISGTGLPGPIVTLGSASIALVGCVAALVGDRRDAAEHHPHRPPIGLARSLAPGERDVMLDSMVPMVEELSRLEVLRRDVDLERVPGFSATVKDFRATSTLLRDDVAAVRVTDGSISTRIDVDQLPIGSFLRDLLGDALDDPDPLTDTSRISGDEDDPIVVQKVGKRWYVSLNWSVGAAGRTRLPAAGGGVPAKGAVSPEAAVTDLMTAMADLDVRRMIELMPPDELPALHDLAGEFVGDAEEAVREVRGFYDLSLRPELRTTELAGDRVLVSLVDLPMNLTVDANGNRLSLQYAKRALSGTFGASSGERARFEGDLTKRMFSGSLSTPAGENLRASFAEDCLSLDLDGDEKRACGNEEIASLFSELTGAEISADDLSGTGAATGAECRPASARPKPALGFVTVKRKGFWYVSPSRTMLVSVTESLRQLDRASLDCIRDQLEQQIGDLGGLEVFGVAADPPPGLGDSTFEPPIETVPGDAPPDTVAFESAPS